ncbi:hypothetical protein D3C81_173690 [compost metagenome]
MMKISCWATGGPFGVGVYEIHDEHERFLGYAPVAELKEKGLVRRIDHNKKVEEFLNTDEGKEWFKMNRRLN